MVDQWLIGLAKQADGNTMLHLANAWKGQCL